MDKKVLVSLVLFVFGCFFSTLWAQKDPVLLTINDQDVTRSEFLQIYLKNNNDPKFDKASLDSYLDLFKRFKLKVEEAKHLKYDTLPSLQKELVGYRKQLARPYLTDSIKNKALVKEAYERMKYEVEASHILVMLTPDASPEDTLKAHKKIMGLKKRLANGEDFATLAEEASEDPSAKTNKGYLGYFTAFQMVYAFETAAYETEVGEVGGPVRTKYGYHLVKVSNKRPARGAMRTAHIMIAARKDADPADIQLAEKKINEIHQKIKDGEDFHKMASLYSDDIGTRQKGGRLPEFGSGTNQRMVPDFENVAFALENDGDVSEPFSTDYGFHIVKRISHQPLGSFEEMKRSVQIKVNKGDRGEKTQTFFVENLKKRNKFKDKSKKALEKFISQVDTSIYAGRWKTPNLKKNATLFSYAGSDFDLETFAKYVEKNQRRIGERSIPIFIHERYKAWQQEQIIADEEGKLESKYPEFKALMREYEDGVLLYEIMKDRVWDKAIKDTLGLNEFYETNKSDYMWQDRVAAEVYSSAKKENILAAYDLLKLRDTLSAHDVRTLMNKDSQLTIAVKVDKFATTDTPFLKDRELVEGVNEIVQVDDVYYLVRVTEFIPAQPKTIKEARGAIIQDYQNYLEESWLEDLRQRHEIKVQHEVLYSLKP